MRVSRLAISLLAGQGSVGARFGASQRNRSTHEAKPAERHATKHAVGACALLTSAEIQTVLGEPVKETKSSAQPAVGMAVSQCVFLTPTFAKSVSLAVTSPANPSARSAREFWRNQFHSTVAEAKKEREEHSLAAQAAEKSEAEAREDDTKPRPIDGLGEEAYWIGAPITGALYVLQGDAFLRISIGGIREESARIDKSKSLASAVLPRLHRSQP